MGLSNFDYTSLVAGDRDQPYEAAHPTIPDSALNYDDRDPPVIRHPDVHPGFSEPDCSPHPFDGMAMYSLYQTVLGVRIEGPDEGIEGTDIILTAKVSGGAPSYTLEWWDTAGVIPTSSATETSVQITLPSTDGEASMAVHIIVTDQDGNEVRTQKHITVKPR